MKIIAVYSIKGGVGKTSAAVNLAYLSAKSGRKTLLWDLDSQGASTFYLHKKQGVDAGVKKIIKGKADLPGLATKTGYKNLHLIPSDFSFRNVDAILDDLKKSNKRLSDSLSQLENNYEVVFLDCPPGISRLAESIFHAAHTVLFPVIPSALSLRSYDQVKHFFKGKKLDRQVIIPFLSMVDHRRKLHKDVMNDALQNLPNCCTNNIPYLSDIEKMGLTRKPVVESHPASRASKAYIQLWWELEKKVF